ncbi:sigma-54-dependent Fis family transcriptional regulator, partial [bacterium]
MSHPKDSIPRFGEIVGKSAAMKTVFSSIEKVASVDYPVLIVGETGTGKDLVAREIHNRSPRSKKPFIPINMSAIPSELVASVLFGHEKGSFTGASESHAGYFQEGKNGTLFLDEISTMDDNVQSALLRVLETKKYRKIGSNKEFKTDSRILAATNQATKILVKSKLFRVDLLHRLQVVQINVPPLRRRKQDIALLVQYFLQVIKQNYDRIAMTISKDALNYLKQYSWPGNVRELRNTIFHAAVLSEGNEIHTKHLPEQILLEIENLN